MKSSQVSSTDNARTLILAPHIDDEVLGCHSFLSPATKVCYLGVEDRPDVSADDRVKELQNVANHKRFEWQPFNFTVNNFDCTKLIGPIEKAINNYRPTRILIPHPSYNQDHRAVYDSAITALRPHDINWFVSVVLIYEQPHVWLWPARALMEPNYYVPIDIEDKINTYKMYVSMVRKHRSAHIIKALAKLRGAQANVRYAEAFVCKRFVEDGDISSNE